MNETRQPLQEKTKEKKWADGLEQIKNLCKDSAETEKINFGDNNSMYDDMHKIKGVSVLTDDENGLSLIEFKDGKVGFTENTKGIGIVYLFFKEITVEIAKKIFDNTKTLTFEERKILAKVTNEKF